jgi:enoyl-CoA hydratase/carnithine racemase
MKEPHILYQTEEHIAKIIINRPEAKNAFSPEMITLWREAW